MLGATIGDVDSLADASNTEQPVDDEIANASGDEDDHDLATLTLAAGTTAAPPVLAFTGSESENLLAFALWLIAIGSGLTLLAGWRREEIETV